MEPRYLLDTNICIYIGKRDQGKCCVDFRSSAPARPPSR